MTPLDRLPFLDQVNAVPHATPKHRLETRLDRAIDAKAARLLDQKQLREWARLVKERDRWRDRKTGRRVLRTLNLDPDRAEAHHVVNRDEWAVRYDVRNGLTLSLDSHTRIERGDYRIEGTAWFTVKGTRYIDATAPVIFVRT